METLLSIILTAMNLLTAVQNTPNISPEFSQYAVTVAQNAIVYAQDQLALSSTTTPAFGGTGLSISPSTPVVTNPVQSATIPVMETPVDNSKLVIIKMHGPTKPDPLNSEPYGEYSFLVSRIDTNGHNVKFAKIDMNAPDNLYTQPQDLTAIAGAHTATDANDWYASFGYTPTASGTKTITFTSDNLTTSTTIDVQ